MDVCVRMSAQPNVPIDCFLYSALLIASVLCDRVRGFCCCYISYSVGDFLYYHLDFDHPIQLVYFGISSHYNLFSWEKHFFNVRLVWFS